MKTIKTSFKILTLLFALASLTVACDGEDGMDGVNGTNGMDGAIGPQGPAGADGENGQNGTDGNANVIASEWIATDYPNEFQLFRQAVFSVEDTRITEEIVNSATILAYFSFSDINDGPIEQVFALPFTEVLTRSVFFEYDYEVGLIRFRQFDNVNDSNDPTPFNGSVRYVIIPPVTSTSTAKETNQISAMLKQGVDIDDYHQVMDYLGLGY